MSRKTIKMYNVPFTQYRPKEATDKEGVDCCPKCKSRSINFLEEEVQHGFDGYDKYFVFNECDDCVHHFVFVMIRKGDVRYDC